jgi:hypothetical protein
MRKSIRIMAISAVAACCVASGAPRATNLAYAGEGFFQKIGDGWKKGNWVPGIPSVRPQTVQEVIFPVCWGSPQDCRDDANKRIQTVAPGGTPSFVSVSYRVDCRDRDTGADRADNTVTATAKTRDAAVAEIERLARSSDLCQGNGDLSRVTVPGSGRYLN